MMTSIEAIDLPQFLNFPLSEALLSSVSDTYEQISKDYRDEEFSVYCVSKSSRPVEYRFSPRKLHRVGHNGAHFMVTHSRAACIRFLKECEVRSQGFIGLYVTRGFARYVDEWRYGDTLRRYLCRSYRSSRLKGDDLWEVMKVPISL